MRRIGLAGLTVAAFAAVVGLTLDASATTRWKNQIMTGDWNTAANWTDGVPASDGVAYFCSPSGTNFVVNVTPPADFTGTIIVSNYQGAVTTDEYANLRPSLMLTLGNAASASWTVKGNGHLVATEGLAERLSPDFAGIVEVKKGSSFTVPQNLNAAVSLVGAGELTLAAGSQLAQARAFAGKVNLPDAADLVVEDTGLLANRSLTVGDGNTLTLEPQSTAFGAIRRFGFGDEADRWTYNGTAWRVGPAKVAPYSAEPPYVTADNVLMLTDDPAQVHTVWYTNRMFRVTDDIGCTFRWTPNLPSDSRIRKAGYNQCQSGNFTISFQSTSPTNCILPKTMSDTMERSNQATRNFGLTMYTYQENQNAHFSWIQTGNKGGVGESIIDQTTEISLAKPIDFTVVVSKGVMTVTMVQDGKSLTVQKTFLTNFNTFNAGGAWFGLGGSSDTWGDSDATVATPWVKHEISNFNGWYRDPLEGGWEPIADEEKYTTINETNWDLKRHVENGNGRSSHATLTGNACLDADGGFSILPTDYYAQTLAFSKTYVPKTKPLKYSMEFDNVAAFPTGNWQGMSFMPFGSNNGVDGWDGYSTSSGGWKFFTSGHGGYLYGFAFQWNIYNGSGEWAYGRVFGKNVVTATDKDVNEAAYAAGVVSRNDSGRATSPKDVRLDFLYDPRGTFTHVLSTDPVGTANGNCFVGTFQVPDDWKTGFEAWKTGRNSLIGFRGQCSSTDIYTLKFKKFRLLQMTSAQAGELGTVLNVAANASATVKAGELMDGQTVQVARFAAADLAKGATLTVKPATSATKAAVGKIVSAGGATLAATSGASVSVGDIELTGADTDTGVTLAGAVALGGTLTVKVPAAWRKTRSGWVTLVDASAATGALPAAEAITLQTEDGVLPTKKYLLQVSDGKVKALFGLGMAILVR